MKAWSPRDWVPLHREGLLLAVCNWRSPRRATLLFTEVTLAQLVHTDKAGRCTSGHVLPYRVPERAGQSLTPAGLFRADETLLFFSHTTAAAFLVFGLAAAVGRMLQQALALHAVPHAITKVDQEAWKKADTQKQWMCELEEPLLLSCWSSLGVWNVFFFFF